MILQRNLLNSALNDPPLQTSKESFAFSNEHFHVIKSLFLPVRPLHLLTLVLRRSSSRSTAISVLRCRRASLCRSCSSRVTSRARPACSLSRPAVGRRELSHYLPDKRFVNCERKPLFTKGLYAIIVLHSIPSI